MSMNNKIIYAIICQSESNIDIVYASFSKRKRDKIYEEKCKPNEDDYNLFYKKGIILNDERKV